VNDDLFTDDLDIASVRTRSQLAALLRTIHLRADRPSLRTLEARTRRDKTPLSKTVVSEMLKGTRFPRKAVMISFLRTCGVPGDMMEPWHRAWERVASGEHDLSGSSAHLPLAKRGQLAGGDEHVTRLAARAPTEGLEMPVAHADVQGDAPNAGAAEQPRGPAGRTGAGRTTHHSPLVRRRELAALLRALRVEAGMTIEQVAERLLCSSSKVSRMETGSRSVTMRDIRDICDLYGVAGTQRDYLAELARESRQQGWWQSYDVPYAAFIGLEADATSIDTFQGTLIPGLLQTADYARALIKTTPELSPELIEQGVTVRLKRQQLLTQDDPPQLRIILDESALHRIIGSHSTMKAQLNHVIEISGLANIAIQVVRYDSGAYAALDSSFTILELPSPIPALVYVEGLFGSVYIDRQQEVERYQRIFKGLRSIAATEEESIVVVARASEELKVIHDSVAPERTDNPNNI
jgi:transcriptional regulator with XRE-family HTH domain